MASQRGPRHDTRVRVVITLLLAACGPKVQPSWVEREAPLGTSHAGADTNGGTPAPVDISKVDLSNIDALDEATVLTVLERIGDAAPAAALALRAARIAHHRGDDGEARALLARAANAADEPTVHAELAVLAKAVALPPVQVQTIAVLLPLSGRFASIGNELRGAIQSAPVVPGTTWLFLDTKGEADGASAAVEQAYARGAIGILGPVGQREALAAARAASLRGVPIALLAPGDGADPAAGVFRLVDSPADEGRAAAKVAQTEGYPAVAVLAPRDDVGGEAADAFAEEATRLGMSVAVRGAYDPTGNVDADVRAFLGLVPAQNPRFAAHLAKVGPKKAYTTFSPDVPYSLLYVPDRYDRAAIVAAFLPYYGIELRTTEFPDPDRLRRKHGGNLPQVVQLVGNSGWNHPSLPIRGGMAVQGAMIVDTCQAARDQAHDAALVVAAARKDAASAPDPRAALRERIARAKLDDGACGPAAMDVDGELHREPRVLEVAGEQLIPSP